MIHLALHYLQGTLDGNMVGITTPAPPSLLMVAKTTVSLGM